MSGNGSGKSDRKGMTLAEMFKMFPDDEAAMEWFEANVWRDGRRCGRCGSDDTVPASHPTMPYWCGGCRKYFSVKFGTIMEHSKISYQHWAMATYQFATNLKGVSSMKLHRDLGITQKSAWFMGQRLRECWGGLADVSNMKGPVEVDETWVGGIEKNKHKDKKRTVEKTAVIGIKDRDSNKVSAAILPEVNSARADHFIKQHKNRDAKTYTDENSIYKFLPNHGSVNYSVGEYVRGMAHTNGIESFWATFARGFNGTYQKISPKHLHRYINESAGMHNIRHKDTVDMMAAQARNMAGKRLTYKDLTGGAV